MFLEGDYNENGVVEQGDLDIVLLNWGTEYPILNEVQFIDQKELDGVLLNWGETSIPEPSSIISISILAVMLLGMILLKNLFDKNSNENKTANLEI